MSGVPYTVENFNPSYSHISDIWLFRDGGRLEEGIRLFVRGTQNTFCQFEKLEMIESIFETFPKGSITVRDTSDIITIIKNKNYDSVYIQYIENTDPQYIVGSITSTSYSTNAASELENNFVTINFTNYLYKFSQQNSLTNVINLKKPVVTKIEDFLNNPNNINLNSKIYLALKDPNNAAYSSQNSNVLFPWLRNIDFTENFILYKPLNALENKTEIPSEDIFKYINYLTSYIVPKLGEVTNPNSTTPITYDSFSPRFMFWTSWNNEMNLKYFYNDLNKDKIANANLVNKNLRFSVYDSDSPTILDNTNGFVYNKIKILTTAPADQFMSTKYFYVRKTPKLLNNYSGNTYSYGNTYAKLAFQFLDEGEKYDVEFVTSEGITGFIPPGANEMIDRGFWGYYDSVNSSSEVGYATHIGHDFGYQAQYFGNTFMGISFAMPFVDCPEMWKNQFDLTPVHPNLGLPITQQDNAPTDYRTFLQKVLDIRYDTFIETQGIPRQLRKIREIERQNFIYYVLCCIGQEQEEDETFFAEINGYKPDEGVFTYEVTGVNNEPLKYLYSWKKLELLPAQYPPDGSGIEAKYFRGLENSEFWAPSLTVGSCAGDDSTWAINLNERANDYSNDPLDVDLKYYAPGWYAENLTTYNNVKYRPIGNNIGPLQSTPSSPDDSTVVTKHIVRMTKTPFSKLLREAGFTAAGIYEKFSGKYLYSFNSGNITDGPCPSI